MSFTAEVKGKAADRYRAYAAEKFLRNATVADYVKRAADNLPPLKQGAKIRYDGEVVALEGDVTGDAVSISAGAVTITKVVFYKGPIEAEVVVGSVEVNIGGTIEISLVEPDDGVEIVDE
jgi:hypothetical protein